MTASTLIKPRDRLHVQPATGTWHATADCSVVRRSRYATVERPVSAELIDAIESGHPHAKLCRKCYGTDGRLVSHSNTR